MNKKKEKNKKNTQNQEKNIIKNNETNANDIKVSISIFNKRRIVNSYNRSHYTSLSLTFLIFLSFNSITHYTYVHTYEPYI